MRYIILSVFLFILIFSESCTKEESLKKNDGLIMTFDSILMDTQIGNVQLADDNFLIVSQNQIIKFNNSGKILWKKNASIYNYYLRNVISIPGGFASIGLDKNLSGMYVCTYDNDGNYLSNNGGFSLNLPLNSGASVTEFIKLSNGNYAVALSSGLTYCGYLRILDHDFKVMYSRVFCGLTDYNDLTIQRLCETPDGGIAITASVGAGDLVSHYINTALIITEPNGIAKSFTLLNDSLKNEMPTEIAYFNGGYFTLTSKMIGWETGGGAFVNYYGTPLIAGSIGIDRFTEGHYTGRTEFNDYPGFGLINSLRKTQDGGYILCGTVNNLGTSIAVSKTKIYFCKLDANLNKQWSRIIPTTYQAIGVDAVPTSDGGYRVTGNLKSFDTYDKMILINTDADGNY